ncbi:hypothetical protein CRG98_041848 [Punica granatum]|uniref:Uncharacterized protein n=1 Tax=Punica granatum TaxID=22663 RepID=A0A2I0I1E0_PUNGR|nr:hypothetical protein CRG98_041848 [Punica granatum]
MGGGDRKDDAEVVMSGSIGGGDRKDVGFDRVIILDSCAARPLPLNVAATSLKIAQLSLTLLLSLGLFLGSSLLFTNHLQRLQAEHAVHSSSQNLTSKSERSKLSMNLLAMTAGIEQKDNVNKIVMKFMLNNFTVMIFHYDGVVDEWNKFEWSSRAIHVSAVSQTKWWFAKRFLHPDIVSEYEYIFLWDEDLEVDNFDPGRRIVQHMDAGFECREDSEGPPCTGVPVIQGDRTKNVGVVDSEYVFHPGKVLLGGVGASKIRNQSLSDQQIFFSRWKRAVEEDDCWTDPYHQRG